MAKRPIEERIELRVARVLKEGTDGHRVFEVECVAHSIRFSSEKRDPQLNPRTDILIRRNDVQSPDYAVRLAQADGTTAAVGMKLPLELPRMVLKVYGESEELDFAALKSAPISGPICWGKSIARYVEPRGFELGTWSLSRYITGMTFDSYLDGTTGDEFDPEAVWADRCYCLAGVADRLAELRTSKGVWVHGDIKPRNIIIRPLTQDGVRPRRSVELIDADALVYLPVEYGDVSMPLPAKACTPRFAAPETVVTGRATRTSDIWSFGVLLFDALCGCHPFACEGDPSKEYWEALYRSDAEPRLDLLASDEARALVAACLDRNPLKRPEPAEVARRMRALAENPPEGFVPCKADVNDATTLLGLDPEEWSARYCKPLEKRAALKDLPEVLVAVDEAADEDDRRSVEGEDAPAATEEVVESPAEESEEQAASDLSEEDEKETDVDSAEDAGESDEAEAAEPSIESEDVEADADAEAESEDAAEGSEPLMVVDGDGVIGAGSSDDEAPSEDAPSDEGERHSMFARLRARLLKK